MEEFLAEPSSDDLKALFARLKAIHETNGEPARALSYVSFGIGGGLNRGYFSFKNKLGSGFYPTLAAVGIHKYASNQTEQNGSVLYTQYAISIGEELGIRAYEYLFRTFNGNYSRPVWGCGLAFVLPARVPDVMSAVSLRGLERWNTAPGTSATPIITLQEFYEAGGGFQIKNWLKVNLTQSQMNAVELKIEGT